MHRTDLIAIGEMARRSGISVSAIRFYEEKGLIASIRNRGGHRRFLRADIRRLSFILIAQQLGFTIQEIGEQLATLPDGRTPTLKDWTRISNAYRGVLDERIADLELLRDRLDGCIGCGCLSLRKCALYNRDDKVARAGAGPRHLMRGGKPLAGPLTDQEKTS